MNDIDQPFQFRHPLGRYSLQLKITFTLIFLLFTPFITASLFIAESSLQNELWLALLIACYMAINIGANDVANNVGPAVGSRAITLSTAIIIAVIFESLGALIAGGEVINTIKSDIIYPALITDPKTYVLIMIAALFSAALWLNLATAMNCPVSTTHSIIGGMIGATLITVGWQVINWEQITNIVMSWIVAPILSGLIATLFLMWIKNSILYHSNQEQAARQTLPKLIAIMVFAFTTYLVIKGLKQIWAIDLFTAILIGLNLAIASYFLVRPLIKKQTASAENDRLSINRLFTIPLIMASAILSFAHGANDVANIVAPLAAVYDTLKSNTIAEVVDIPTWGLIIGALGMSLGLVLFGGRLIKTVGQEITELNPVRAFAVAIAAAITVIFASHLGLPVSTTHVVIGAIFGIGFYREFLKRRYRALREWIKNEKELRGEDAHSFLEQFDQLSVKDKKQTVLNLKSTSDQTAFKNLAFTTPLPRLYQKQLLDRGIFLRIVLAWLMTVPAAAIIAAITVLVLSQWY